MKIFKILLSLSLEGFVRGKPAVRRTEKGFHPHPASVSPGLADGLPLWKNAAFTAFLRAVDNFLKKSCGKMMPNYQEMPNFTP